MGKITKKAIEKHKVSLSPALVVFIEATCTLPLIKLPHHLSQLPTRWPFPRGDLYNWIEPLDRFDSILQTFIEQYGLNEGPQTKPFGLSVLLSGSSDCDEQKLRESGFGQEGDRELIEAILSFSRLLLDKCGNRALYNSSDRLNDILNTTSLSLLQSALRITVFLAQRYSERPSNAAPQQHSQFYSYDHEKLNKLASSFASISPATLKQLTSTPTKTAKGKEKGTPTGRLRRTSTSVNPDDFKVLLRSGKNAADVDSGVSSQPSYEQVWQPWASVKVSWTSPNTNSHKVDQHQLQESTPDMPASPTPVRRQSSMLSRTSTSTSMTEVPAVAGGFTPEKSHSQNIELSASDLSKTTMEDILCNVPKDMPAPVRYDLLHKLRVAYGLMESVQSRQDLLAVRLLALAVLAYIYDEHEFPQKVFGLDVNPSVRIQLIQQIVSLVQGPKKGQEDVSLHLQILGMETLGVLARQRTMSNEITAAMAPNSSHGLLLTLTEKGLDDLKHDNDATDNATGDDWREAIFSLLSAFMVHSIHSARASETLIHPSLISAYVSGLSIVTDKALRVHLRILDFMKSFCHQFKDGLATLSSKQAFEAACELLGKLSQSALELLRKGEGMPDKFKTKVTDYQIPYMHQQVIRSMIDLVNDIIGHQGGHAERILRNLVDSRSLLTAFHLILSNIDAFGAHTWSEVVKAIVGFLHNEPTSYTIISEAGITKILLDMVVTPGSDSPASSDTVSDVPKYVKLDVPANADAIVNLSQAFGAICLTSSGFDNFRTSGALEKFFEIFESPAHVKVIRDSNTLALLGSTFDELVRHHPPLKNAIVSAVITMMARVRYICRSKAWETGAGAKLWLDGGSRQLTVAGGTQALTEELVFRSSMEPTNQVIPLPTGGKLQVESQVGSFDPSTVISADGADQNGLTVVDYAKPAICFLLNFFENQPLCSFFMEQGATDVVLDFITLPALSADDQTFGRDAIAHDLASLVHMMAETKPHLVLPVLTDRTRYVCTEALEEFSRDQPTSLASYFAPLVKTSNDEEAMEVNDGQSDAVIQTGTKAVKGLTSVYFLTKVLSEIFNTPMYNTRTSGASSIFFQANVADIISDLCRTLGSVAAACYREEIALRGVIPEAWLTATRPDGFSTGDDEVDKILSVRDVGSENVEFEGADKEEPKTNSDDSLKADKQSAAFRNVQTLRYLLIETPSSISDFLQRLGRGIVTKRRMDHFTKQKSNMVAAALAEANLTQLRPRFISPKLLPDEDTKVKEARFAYLLIALAYVRNSLVDDTLSSGPFTGRQSLVVDHFRRAGGVKRLTEIGIEFFDELKSCKVAQSMFSANTGLKHCLDILDDFTSVHNICDSHHGQWLKETSLTRPYYFNPAQLLLELRMEALTLTRKIWDSDYADQASADVVQKLVSILRHVFNGEQETEAVKTASSYPKVAQQQKRRFVVHNDVVTRVANEKGFPEDLVREAMYRSACTGTSSTKPIEEYCAAIHANPRRRRLPIPDDEVETGSLTAGTGLRSGGSNPVGDLPTLREGTHPVIDATLEEVVSSINDNDMDDDDDDEEDDDDDDDFAQDRGLIVHDNTSSAMDISNILNEPEESAAESAPVAEHSTSEAISRPPPVYTVETIENQRKEIRENLAERCNNILENHQNLTFELSELITSATQRLPDDAAKTYWENTCDLLVNALLSRQAEEEMTEPQAKKIAAAAHLIALLIQDNDVFKATMKIFQESFESLIGFLRLPPLTVHNTEGSSSPWVAPVLLIVERMLSLDAEPAEIKWAAPNDLELCSEPRLTRTNVFKLDEKKELFELLNAMLPRVGKDKAMALAIVRVLVILTRVREIATIQGQKGSLQRLFLMVKQLGNGASGRLHNSFMLVLRHIIEDEETIKQIMRSEITANFVGRSATRPYDLTSYVRENYHLALRAPDLFVEISNEKVKLSGWSPHSSNSSLVLKETNKSQGSSEGQQPSTATDAGSSNKPAASIETSNEVGEELEKIKTTDNKPPIVEHPDGVIHFLLSELLAYKDVDDKESSKPSNGKAPDTEERPNVEGQEDRSVSIGPESADPPVDKLDKAKFKAEDHPMFLYRCFILHCLTELLYSYNRTKIEFINFSRKADPMAVTPSKPRSGILNYLLSALVSSGYVDKDETVGCKKSMVLSDWAMKVIVALCTKTGEMGLAVPSQRFQTQSQVDDQDTEPDLAFVRRFVLEHAIKAFKDATASSEPLQTKYGRLLCLADLFRRLLTKPTGPDGTAGTHNNSYKMLGRMMFEKNLIFVLTSSLAEIDLSFPSAKKVIKFILRPLQELTSLAVHLSMNSPEAITSVMSNDQDDVISSASSASVSDIDDDGREETPDLFRNSALGMLDPGRQDESDTSEDEDEDEEMYDEDYDDEMEYDDGGPALNDGEVVSDEEIEHGMEDIGPIEGIPGDVPMDIEFVVNGAHDIPSDDDEDSEDEEEDEDEDSDDDENDDFEIEMDDDEGEVNADDENDSLGGGQGHEGDWEDEDGDNDDEDDEDDEGDVDVTFEGDDLAMPPDLGLGGGQAELNNLLRVLAASDRDGLPPPPQLTAQDDNGEHEQDDEEEDEGDEGDDIDEGDGMDYGDGFLMTDGFDDLERGGPWDNFDEPPPFFHRHRHSTALGRNAPGFNRRVHALGEHDVHHHHHHHHHHPMGVRHHRHPPQPRGAVDDGANPLLQRPDNAPGPRSILDMQPFQVLRPSSFPPAMLPTADGRGVISVPISMSLPFSADNPDGTANGHSGVVLDAIMQALQRGGDPTFLRTGRLSGFQVHVNAPYQDMRDVMRTMSTGFHGRPPKEDPSRAAAFSPAMTTSRWQEEARMLFGSVYIDKVQRVQIRIMSQLVPLAQKEEKERRQKRAEEEERRKKEAEEAEKSRQEEERLRKEQEEREAAERAEAEARARAEAEAAAAAAEAASQSEQNTQGESAEPMEGIQVSQGQGEGAVSEEPTAEPARIFTTIRGRQLDITGLSIDLEYLDALPEDLREEVIMAQYTERHENAQDEGGDASAIDPDFLNALPDDIREEIRQQEAHIARRRQRDEARRQAQQGVGGAQAEEMDNDNFFATLDPALRRAILAEQPPEILSQLDPRHAAEGRAQQRGLFFNRMGEPRDPRHNGRPRADAAQKDSKRQVVQLIDKAGVATLLRLMFLPQQGSLRQNLWTVLGNVCGNRQTRFEVISLLLIILREGSTDIGAVERSLANLSLRARAVAAAKTPQELKRTLSMPGPAGLGDEITPMTVVQQCLAALQALCRLGIHVRTIFLREVDITPAKTAKKGKGKENKSVKYPINDLISLLDRRLIMDSSNCLQALAELLASVTSPLTFFMKKDKEQAEEKKEEAAAAAQEVQTGQADTEAPESQHPEISGQDTAMIEAPSANQEASSGPGEGEVATLEEPASSTQNEETGQEEKKKPFEPPVISEHNLQLITGVFVAPECHNETFHSILETLSSLSYIPGTSIIFSKELINHVQALSQAICADLDELLPLIKEAISTSDLQGMTSSKFSAGSSDQVKLLRVLQALDYLSAPKKDSEAEEESASVKSILNSSYDTLTLGPLWNKLSDCLTAVREKGDTIGFANILLPLIESLMVVCKNTPLKDAPITGQAQEAVVASPVPTGMNDLEELFFRFTAEHRKILNDIVRQNPKLMQGNGNFSLLVKNSKVLDFDNKRNYFTKQIHSRHHQRHVQPPLQLSPRRDHVFLDSFKSLYFKSAEEMKYGKLNIRFQGEEGVDAGGVTREWFHVLARGMFDANYALFQPVASDRTTFHPNPLSGVNDQHLLYFKFIGRIIGKALHEGRVLDCHFSRAVYKRILGKSPNLKDLESNDVDYYKSLVWILENDITDILTEEFCVIESVFGEDKIIDLIPDGRNIAVTEQNKKEYVQKLVEYRLTESVSEQLDNFLQGFHDIIPAELVAIFNEQELELLISGLPEIDVDDWKANTEYHNYSPSSPQIVWFWRIVRGMTNEERAKLLQFITGTSKVPLNGFKELEGVSGLTKHNIHKDPSTTRLPTSHTCFNQLDLPAYDSFELMKQNLMTAINLGADYFGFA